MKESQDAEQMFNLFFYSAANNTVSTYIFYFNVAYIFNILRTKWHSLYLNLLLKSTTDTKMSSSFIYLRLFIFNDAANSILL